jgi:uncharacterized cupin superfamily protein
MTNPDIIGYMGAFSGLVLTMLAIAKYGQAVITKRVTKIVNTARADVLHALGTNMERQFANIEKSTYVTLDYRMDGDTTCIRIPLHMAQVTECLQGMRLQLIEHSPAETIYSVSTIGHHAPIRLHWHYHEETETVTVIIGTVTDVQTGRIYRVGESWSISPGVRHIADIDGYAVCTVRPPLPFASQHPICVNGIKSVYESNPPSL